VTVAHTLSSSVKVVRRIGMAEAERHGWPLAGAAHSTSQGRPHQEGVRYILDKLLTSPTYPSSTLHVTSTPAHTYQFPSSPWANAHDHDEVSSLRSRVGWTSARNNEKLRPENVACINDIMFTRELESIHSL